MGYQIQYAPDKRMEWGRFQRKKIPIKVLICMILICVAIGAKPLRKWLSPGDPQVTDRAVIKMVDSLRSGDSFMEAATVFCLEVMECDVES